MTSNLGRTVTKILEYVYCSKTVSSLSLIVVSLEGSTLVIIIGVNVYTLGMESYASFKVMRLCEFS